MQTKEIALNKLAENNEALKKGKEGQIRYGNRKT